MRPLVIGLLVVYHALCVFTGGWAVPEGVEPIRGYWWMGKLISGFRIETITFIAGYVYAYQCIERKKNENFLPMAWKKIHRLIIPCVIFGLIYWMLFYYKGVWHWKPMILRLLGGVGHLWFLPMLFWCFLLMWWIVKLVKPEKRKWLGIVVLIVLGGLSILKNPKWILGTSQVNHFLFYFYGGYMMWVYRKQIWNVMRNWTMVAVFWLVYVGVLLLRLKVGLVEHWSWWILSTLKMVQIVSGIIALYLLICKVLENKTEGPGERVIWCSGVCYGVYVFHMFIMQWLYYYTSLPMQMASWILPWVVFAISMCGSLLITELLLKCKVGRWLIG